MNDQETGERSASMGPTGKRFRYANHDALLAARALRTRLGDGAGLVSFPSTELLWPIGLTHTSVETDWRGNFILMTWGAPNSTRRSSSPMRWRRCHESASCRRLFHRPRPQSKTASLRHCCARSSTRVADPTLMNGSFSDKTSAIIARL